MLDPNLNPNIEIEKLSMIQWIWKYCKKQMIFTFLFTCIFIFAPWTGMYYVEQTSLRWLISSIGIAINFVATFLHPYFTYRSAKYNYEIWNKNNEKGWYK